MVPSSPRLETAEQPAKLSDLFSKSPEVAEDEERQKGKFVGAVIPILGFLGKPVSLRPESLGGSFLGFESVTLGEGATVTMTDPEGRVSSKRLSAFSTDECLAILEESFPELQRLVSEKRRAGEAGELEIEVESERAEGRELFGSGLVEVDGAPRAVTLSGKARQGPEAS